MLSSCIFAMYSDDKKIVCEEMNGGKGAVS